MRINALAYGCFVAYAFMATAHGELSLHDNGGQSLTSETVQQVSKVTNPATSQPTKQATHTPIKLAGEMVDETVGEQTSDTISAEVQDLPTTLSDEEQALFYQCAKLSDNVGRLACFDAISAHEQPSAITQKQSLDLTGTLKSTIAGSPQVVLTDNTDNTDKYNKDPKAPSDKAEEVQVLTELALPKEALSRYTPLSLAFDLDKNSERGLWSARPHNANYFLPFYLHGKPNRTPTSPTLGSQTFSEDEMRDVELKFQLSLKTKAMENVFGTNADLWIGYTQLSHWQVYNENHSRPFRAHDYEPEVFLTQPVSADLPWGGKLRVLGAGGVHHSNGETDPLSRSWNRLYVMGGAEWGKLTVMPRLWTRLKKNEGSKPEDNPDITDYYGYGDVRFLYQLDKGKNVSGLVRFNPSTKKGAIELDYVYPLHRGISGFLQIFHGYGQSLIDYNRESTSIGVGIMLTDWMGL